MGGKIEEIVLERGVLKEKKFPLFSLCFSLFLVDLEKFCLPLVNPRRVENALPGSNRRQICLSAAVRR